MSDELEVVRLALIRQAPWRSSAALALIPVLKDIRTSTDEPTLSVDSYWRLYWCPEALARWSTQEAAAVLWHECEHLLRRHHQRADAVDAMHEVWNLAADAEINDDIPGLPLEGITPKGLSLPEGLTAEEYYKLLMGNRSPKVRVFGHGSGAGATPGPWELPAPGDTPGSTPGLSEAEARLVEAKTAQAIQEAISTGHGDVPGHWKVWAEAVLAPERAETWERRFQTLLSGVLAAGREDYTYSRLDHVRGHIRGTIAPGLVRRRPTVALVVDTSGSMIHDGGKVLGAASAICKAVGEVVVVAGDAAVAATGRVQDAEGVRALATGGGGTRMCPLIEQACRLRPDVIVVLTDGDTPWPVRKPRIPVIVALTNGERRAPAWAKVVQVEAT